MNSLANQNSPTAIKPGDGVLNAAASKEAAATPFKDDPAFSDLDYSRLWTLEELGHFLKLSVQTLYDYRYRQRIDTSIFIIVGKKLRVNPRIAVTLAMEGKLIKLD